VGCLQPARHPNLYIFVLAEAVCDINVSICCERPAGPRCRKSFIQGHLRFRLPPAGGRERAGKYDGTGVARVNGAYLLHIR